MIVFDTDLSFGTPGAEIDDGAALIFLHQIAKEEVAAVTTVHGNTDLPNVLHNTRRMLAYLDWTVPLGRGAEQGLIEQKEWFAEWQAGYGPTEPWPDEGAEGALPSAVNLIVDLIRANPHEVTIIAVGPLTNLALAARLAPDVVPLTRQIIAMGSSFGEGEADAEFNTKCDPEATQIVLSAGWPIKLIGLNITTQVQFSRADFAALLDQNRAIALLKKQAQGWIDRVESKGWGDGGCALHDVLAAAAYFRPDLFTWHQTGVAVDLWPQNRRGVSRFVSVSEKHPPIEIATAVDVAACRQFIKNALYKI